MLEFFNEQIAPCLVILFVYLCLNKIGHNLEKNGNLRYAIVMYIISAVIPICMCVAYWFSK